MADPFAVQTGDNWVDFSFQNDPGYDRVQARVHGTPEFVAEKFGIPLEGEDAFDGKISTLMKRATEVDAYFKGLKAGPKGN